MKNDKTDTPRTDSAIEATWYGADEEHVDASFARQLERELTEIRNALGDKGRRTHKELIELATKAAEWRTWKEKYIDLRNAHIAEGQDPAGTIWEHADKIQQELKASKAEVERLKAQLSRAVAIGEALSSELYFPDFVNELNAFKASLSSPSSL